VGFKEFLERKGKRLRLKRSFIKHGMKRREKKSTSGRERLSFFYLETSQQDRGPAKNGSSGTIVG